MGDNWEDEWGAPKGATTTTEKPAESTDNNNNFSKKSFGFGGNNNTDTNNNEETKGFGFGKRNSNENGGFRPRNNENRGGFGAPRDDNGDNKGGFRRSNNEGGFGRNDGNRENRGFGGNRQNDGENRGFGRRSNDEGGESRGGFGRRQGDDNGGGEGRSFGGRRNDGGDNRGGFGGARRSDENRGFSGNRQGGDGEGRRFGGGNRDNGENRERKSFGDNFKPRQNDDGKSPARSFGSRQNDENGGEKKSFGGFGGPRRSDDGAGENKGGFGFKPRQGGDEGGEGKRFGGFQQRQGEDGGQERRSFGSSRPVGGGGGGFGANKENGGENNRGGGGFRRQNNEDGGENKRFGSKFGQDGDNQRSFRRTGDSQERKPFDGNRNRSQEREGRGERRNFREDRERGGDDQGGAGEIKKESYIPPEIEDNEETLFHTIPTGVNFKKQAEIPVRISGEEYTSIIPLQKFSDAKLSDLLFENIVRSKYEIPTPVQKYAIPTILKRRDLMACAQTGSGKTAAYVVPILKNILDDGIQSSQLSTIQTPQALILAPTRELARQILAECRKFSFKSIIRSNILYGGTVTGYQVKELEKGTNILVATPGRLLDILNKNLLSFEKLKYIVLDEADRMLDMGFEKNVREILSKCTMSKTERCTFMFSATFPEEIQKMAQDFLNNYIFLAIGTVGGANTDVEQLIYKTGRFDRRAKLVEILNEIGQERTMVFVEHKKEADQIAFFLIQKGYPTTSIHGDRLQSQREKALSEFIKGDAKIIVATSVAARGLDISDVNHVINYDLPQTIDEYVHRIGRTGRCGNIGKSISFFNTESENDLKLARNLVSVLTDAGKEVPDWLSAIADDSTGGSHFLDAGKHADDIRDDFRSLALTTSTAGVATNKAGGDDDW